MQYKTCPDSLLLVLTQPGSHVRELIKQLFHLLSDSKQRTALGGSQVEFIDQEALNRAEFFRFRASSRARCICSEEKFIPSSKQVSGSA